MEDVLFQLGIGPEEIHLHWLATAFQNTVENNALPSPWELVEYVEDEVSYYYHNTETSETSWDHPMLAMFQAEVASCRHRAKTNFLANEHFASKRRQWVWGRLKSIVVRMKRLNDRAGAWFATNIVKRFFAGWSKYAGERNRNRVKARAFVRAKYFKSFFHAWREAAFLRSTKRAVTYRQARRHRNWALARKHFAVWHAFTALHAEARAERKETLGRAEAFHRKITLRKCWPFIVSAVDRRKATREHLRWQCSEQNRLFSAYLNVEDLHAAKCTCQSWHALVQHFCTTVRRLFPPHFQVTRRPRGKVGTLVSTVCFFANVVHLDISRGGGRRRYNGSGIVSQEQIHDNHLIKIGKHLKALETVNLENNYSITGQGVATASKHWPMLKRVNVRGCNITRMHCFETLCTDHDRLKYVEFGPSEKRADVDSGPGRSLPAPRKFDACKVFFYCSGRLKALPDPPRLRTLILSGVRTNLVEMINVLSVLGRGLQTLDISSTFVWGESEDVRKTLKAVPCIRRVKVVNALKGRDSAVGGAKRNACIETGVNAWIASCGRHVAVVPHYCSCHACVHAGSKCKRSPAAGPMTWLSFTGNAGSSRGEVGGAAAGFRLPAIASRHA